ncbi:DUF305 domain-containing protein [Bradyrhizobium sp. McL0616]|uniref:DUF305 domain-containing protein n=1 Tax=Bradyrhizobium sp. McL0616 TaxID=3415674 RepID=UPI003CF62A4C
MRALTDEFSLCVGAAQSSDADEGAFLAATATSMTNMMKDMTIGPAGDIDRDFVSMMVAHHQGAIDMAQAELRYGRNERLRRMAQEIIVTQQQEIAAMLMAIGQPLPPSVPAPDQVVSAEPNNSTPPTTGRSGQGALK